MTPREFKAWFDGFTEAFSDKVPTVKQWARIKERVGEIDGNPVTERIFVDRYWSTYPYHSYPVWISAHTNPIWSSTSAQQTRFNSSNAMYALGQNDAVTVGQ